MTIRSMENPGKNVVNCPFTKSIVRTIGQRPLPKARLFRPNKPIFPYGHSFFYGGIWF